MPNRLAQRFRSKPRSFLNRCPHLHRFLSGKKGNWTMPTFIRFRLNKLMMFRAIYMINHTNTLHDGARYVQTATRSVPGHLTGWQPIFFTPAVFSMLSIARLSGSKFPCKSMVGVFLNARATFFILLFIITSGALLIMRHAET